jgi:hypothetical protein
MSVIASMLVSSCGFWPGGGPVNEAAFYAYAYLEPQGFKDYPIQPQEAFYHKEGGSSYFPMTWSEMPRRLMMYYLSFLQTTYEAAATCAKWDRQSLERQ